MENVPGGGTQIQSSKTSCKRPVGSLLFCAPGILFPLEKLDVQTAQINKKRGYDYEALVCRTQDFCCFRSVFYIVSAL